VLDDGPAPVPAIPAIIRGYRAWRCAAPINRWLADYCKPYRERLFGVAMLPMQSVELAIDEMWP
jgi:hypothetical protein